MPLLDSVLGRAVLLVVLLGVTSALWFLHARRSGVMSVTTTHTDRSSASDRALAGPEEMLAEATRVHHGTRATFVQLSSDVCSPCRRTATVLKALAHEHPGVTHIEIDVEEHDVLVRRLGVLRTPTVFLLDPAGRVLGRSCGAMTRSQAESALALSSPSTSVLEESS